VKSLAALILLSVSLLVPAAAQAADPPLGMNIADSLANQVQDARSALSQDRTDLVNAKSQRAALLAMQNQARRRVPLLKAQVAKADQAVAVAKDKLNKLTLSYIHLVQSVGGNPAAAGMDDAQQLLQYLGSSRFKDAALVMQQSQQMLRQQEAAMNRIRAAASKLKIQQQQAHSLADRLQESDWQASQAVRDNELKINVLRHQIATNSAAVSELEMRLGLTGGGGVLTAGQIEFAYRLAELSRLDINVIKAWVLAEMSDSYSRERQAEGNHNWLNIGYFDSLGGGGAFQDLPQVWQSPEAAARASQAFLQGDFLGASPGIQKIISSAGKSYQDQIHAIAVSGWASSGYAGGSNLLGTYRRVPHTMQPPARTVRWQSPRDHKWYLLGR